MLLLTSRSGQEGHGAEAGQAPLTAGDPQSCKLNKGFPCMPLTSGVV